MSEQEYVVFGKDENNKLVKVYVYATDKDDAIQKANQRYNYHFYFAKKRSSCGCGS